MEEFQRAKLRQVCLDLILVLRSRIEVVGVTLNAVIGVEFRQDSVEELDAFFSGHTSAGEAELRDPDLAQTLAIGEVNGFVDVFEEGLGVFRSGLSFVGVPVDDEEIDVAISTVVEEFAHPAETLAICFTAGNTRAAESPEG